MPAVPSGSDFVIFVQWQGVDAIARGFGSFGIRTCQPGAASGHSVVDIKTLTIDDIDIIEVAKCGNFQETSGQDSLVI